MHTHTRANTHTHTHNTHTHTRARATCDAMSGMLYCCTCLSIALSTWRAVKSARLFVSEKERTHFLTILGEEAPRNIKASASRDNILPKETNEDVVLEEDSFQEEELSILEKVDKDYSMEESKSEEETDSNSQDNDCET